MFAIFEMSHAFSRHAPCVSQVWYSDLPNETATFPVQVMWQQQSATVFKPTNDLFEVQQLRL